MIPGFLGFFDSKLIERIALHMAQGLLFGQEVGHAAIGAFIKMSSPRFSDRVHTDSDPSPFGFAVKHLDLFAFDAQLENKGGNHVI
jgi:hypothetical protein